MVTAFRSCLAAIAAVTLLAAVGCDRQAPKPPAVMPAAQSASPAVSAQPVEAPVTGGNRSPADGAAIGGVPANQAGGGVRKGAAGDGSSGAPEPTGGDGAASAAAK